MKIKQINKASKLFLAGIVSVATASLLSAAENSSLVAIEGGYSNLSSEITNRAVTPNSYEEDKTKIGNVGLKIGAESKNYRVFLNGRYYFADAQYDSLATYGIDFQYKFDFSSAFDIFVGVGAGIANAKFNVPSEPFSRTISDPYYSGDIGVNLHVAENIDIEIGGRYMSLEALNSKSDMDYKFNDIMTAYASIVYKFELD